MTSSDRTLATSRQDAAEIREAARILLRTPIVTVARSPESMSVIRKHAATLRKLFATNVGYHLVVEASFARLAKSPPEHSAAQRVVNRRNGTPFGARGYTLLALACSALLAPGVGEQILLSALVTQMRTDAAQQEIPLSDSIADRRLVVAALAVLLEWGVLTEVDGTVAQWGESAEEALLTICRPLLPHLLTRPIGSGADRHDLLTPEPDSPRRRLRRRLVEEPVVLRSDLDPDELDVLSRERSELTRMLGDAFGLVLEVRAEGALGYDPAASLSDIEFPGTGSAKQAALLLIGALLDLMDDSTAGSMEFAWPVVDSVLADLVRAYGRAWRSEYADAPEVLRDDTVALLTALRLAESTPDVLVLNAAAARYRPQPKAVGTQLTFD
ncbi:TIGR02678 family protein [Nocardia sp. NPDC057272]|uniref:TIGR02678 family protein n=1 Tax=Nocardia sp. NPDC057272 TaxID=3346079 RepID=UPI003627517D